VFLRATAHQMVGVLKFTQRHASHIRLNDSWNITNITLSSRKFYILLCTKISFSSRKIVIRFSQLENLAFHVQFSWCFFLSCAKRGSA